MWKVTAKSSNEAEVLLYDEISEFNSEDWGLVNAKSLINKIKDLGNITDITLRINSVGGDVFEAQAMYSYLKSHPANITVKIDGLAASAASVVAMAGNKIIMPKNTLMMIHNPAGGVWGQADDMRDTAEILDKIRETIANVYIAKTGLDHDKIIAMMDAETWLTADEALAMKFCDEVGEAVKITNKATKAGGFVCMSSFGLSMLDDFMSAKLPEKFRNIQEEKEKMPNTQAAANTQTTELPRPTAATPQPAQTAQATPPVQTLQVTNDAEFQRGILAERERLKLLDSLNAPGREAIINKAKYEEPKDARDIAIELLQADKNSAALNAMHSDAQAVNSALEPQIITPNSESERERISDLIAKNVNSMRGY